MLLVLRLLKGCTMLLRRLLLLLLLRRLLLLLWQRELGVQLLRLLLLLLLLLHLLLLLLRGLEGSVQGHDAAAVFNGARERPAGGLGAAGRGDAVAAAAGRRLDLRDPAAQLRLGYRLLRKAAGRRRGGGGEADGWKEGRMEADGWMDGRKDGGGERGCGEWGRERGEGDGRSVRSRENT